MFILFFLICLPFLSFVILSVVLYFRHSKTDQKLVAFFHPYCNAGGGGERVLWQAISCMQKKYPQHLYIVYTGDSMNNDDVIKKVKNTFGIEITAPVKFVKLNRRSFVEAKNYPYFTMLAQSCGSIFLGLEAMYELVPDVVIDTMGYSFTYFIFRMFQCDVISYTHYPTLSTQMLDDVMFAQEAISNRRQIAQSRILTAGKIAYLHIFCVFYRMSGWFAHAVMVNSSWTKAHIINMWQKSKTYLVYPPCNVEQFKELALDFPKRNMLQIVSVAQFRPEKNHKFQLHMFSNFLQSLSDSQKSQARLLMIGSVRGVEDDARVTELKKIAKDLNIQSNVEFKLNVNFDEMLQMLQESNIGLHTMKNEHFGISVVEKMAAGLITIAHRSGGPQADIIEDGINGFLAETIEEYCKTIHQILRMNKNEMDAIRLKGRENSDRFTDEKFNESFLDVIQKYV